MHFEGKNSLAFGPQKEIPRDLDANCATSKKELASKQAII